MLVACIMDNDSFSNTLPETIFPSLSDVRSLLDNATENCNNRHKQHRISTYLFSTMSTQAPRPVVAPNPDEDVDDFDGKNSPPLLSSHKAPNSCTYRRPLPNLIGSRNNRRQISAGVLSLILIAFRLTVNDQNRSRRA